MTLENDWSGKRILITGGSGVIGKSLAQECEIKFPGHVHVINSSAVDLRNQVATEQYFLNYKPDLVFHLAARVSGIMGNMKNRASAYLDNIRINTNVIEASRLSGAKKIVAMGTTAVYSDQVPLPMSEEDLWLGAPHISERPYGQAKRAMLAQLEAYEEQYGLQFAYCISTNLYGPHDKFDEENGHVIPSLISKFSRAVEENESVSVWGTGSPQRDFLFSEDAAAALLLIAGSGNGAVNLASGSPTSIRACAEILAEISGYSKSIEWDKSKPNGQMLRDYNINRLLQMGFKPKYSLNEGLDITYKWYNRNKKSARR